MAPPWSAHDDEIRRRPLDKTIEINLWAAILCIMALADRHYMRDGYHPPRITTALILVLIGAFAVQSALQFYGDIDAINQLGLTAAGLKQGKVWQILTFQFLHSCPWPWHVLFNCLGLYFFGRPVEETLGGKRFLGLYLISGVAGGLLQVVLTLVLPRHADIPVVGASAGVCGMLAIFCSLHPMEELRTWIYFLPITVRARYLLIFVGLLSLFGAFVPFDNIAHGAHLGGIIVGISYVRWWDSFWGGFAGWGPLRSRQRKQELVRAANVRGRPWRRGATQVSCAPSSEEFMSRQVDPILEKISAQGIQSLTERELKILETARKRITQPSRTEDHSQTK
jgi:membrane associated rhomboid family serine protease